MTEPPEQPRAAVVLLAAGEGRRVGHPTNKVLLPLAGRPVFAWSLGVALSLPEVARVVVVVRDGEQDAVAAALPAELGSASADGPVEVVPGGRTRHASEWRAIEVLAPAVESGDLDVVAIHDAARPLADAGVFRAVLAAARRHGGAIPVREQAGLVPADPAGPRLPSRVVAVQTPQAFRAGPLLEAYRRADAEGFVGTDTASCVERYTGVEVHCVPGGAANVKITFPEDLRLAECLLARRGG